MDDQPKHHRFYQNDIGKLFHKVQDISGETKSYNVDLKVTNDGDKVIQTYVFEYKK